MAKVHAITRAYLELHPGEAARVLEHVAPANCAALLNDVALRLALDVLKHMLPAHAARCLEYLKPQTAIGLLRTLSPHAGADLLRHVPEDERAVLLTELPAGVALGLQLLLSYPEDAVGAWLDTRVPTLPPDATIKEALDRIKRSAGESGDYIYVVHPDQRLHGVARLPDLVCAPGRGLIAPLSVAAPQISARASLAAAKAHAGWNDFHALAAVDHQGHFLGALPYAALRRARAGQAPIATSRLVTETLGTVATTYWFGLSHLIQALVPLLTGRRNSGANHGR